MQSNWKVLLYSFFLCIAIAQTATAKSGSIITTGTVRDNQGRPVEGAEMMIVPDGRKAVFSDSRGQFEITWNPHVLRSGTTVYIVARDKGENLALVLPMVDDTGSLTLTLKPAVSLLGRIVDPENNAINGAQLSLSMRLLTSISTIDSQSRTNSNGVFKIDAIPFENQYRITIKADGYGQKSISFDTKNIVNEPLDLGQIELPLADMSVTGQVVDVMGNPVPGMEVYCAGEGQPSCYTKSDEKGYFMLDGVCAGLVRFFAEGQIDGESLSCQVLTEAGARDVKVVVTENGYSRSRYIRTKSHEEIINSGKPYIAGWVVDENGVAVAEVPVNVRCVQSKNEKGKDTESYFQFTKFGDVTDEQGRFAIELEEEATYSLLFSPIHHAALIVYDVVPGTEDLKVILPKGGIITGRLVRFQRGEKEPVPDAGIELKQTNHMSYSYIGSDRDLKTRTDSEGRFRFEHIRTLIRTDRQRPVLEPRIWELRSGDASQPVKFLPGETVKHIELVIRPDLAKATPLKGKGLPGYTGISIDLNQDRFRDRKLLMCFFDYEQRPARRYVLQLNGRHKQLKEQGVEIVAVQVSKTSENEIAQWVKTTNISIPVATVIGDLDETRFIWNVQSLPWLILTDREHKVIAEGFALQELDDKLKTD